MSRFFLPQHNFLAKASKPLAAKLLPALLLGLSSLYASAEVTELSSDQLDETFIEGVSISIEPESKTDDANKKASNAEAEMLEKAAERNEELYAERNLKQQVTLPSEQTSFLEALGSNTAVSIDGKALLSQQGDTIEMRFLTPNQNQFKTIANKNILINQQGDQMSLFLNAPNQQ